MLSWVEQDELGMQRGDSKNGGGSDIRDKKVARGFQRIVRGHGQEEKWDKQKLVEIQG